MKYSFQDLELLSQTPPPELAVAIEQYFERLKLEPIREYEKWAEEILTFGGEILATGTSDSQIILLEQGWNPYFTSQVRAAGIENKWFELELSLIRKLNYTPGLLFQRRATQLAKQPLFNFKQGREWQNRSWSATRNTVDHLAAGLIDLMGSNNPRMAILSENRLEVAYTDIACLSYGFVNVPIQSAAPPAQVEYILHHAEIEGIFISDSQHLRTIESVLHNLPKIKYIITYNDVASTNPRVISFKRLLQEAGSSVTLDWLEGIRLSVTLDSIASIMYTSGTTGYPKGIVFTYENIISKRFARSLALNLGGDDRFLCFLPLFHTFGRFLEMWGSIFWGATYTFSSGKGIQSLLSDLKDMEPTVLISIPKRWQDIYETIGAKVDLVNTDKETVHEVVSEVTGGSLHWGLSAAGYLPPEIFRFFQEHDLNLHSGYGMTEATGGITMTPTRGYQENSVGVPLPGMEIKIADDGELFIRGAYVSGSYWKPIDPDVREDRWFTTGDIFQTLANGQIEIIDRKKEIYKNAKGQTVAPQKIENMFRDFDSIYQLFIVGDHMPYNTALVRVNRKHEDIKQIRNLEQDLRDYVATVIHSVNSFLAPFERIVDFQLVERDFLKEKGELTEKGTFKRVTILENYKNEVEELYERPYKSFYMGDLEIQIPNWVFSQRGWTQNDLEVKDNSLTHRNLKASLHIEPKESEIKIGSFNYQIKGNILQFDDFIRQPAYCVGNQELETFLNYSNLRIKPLNKAPVYLPGTWTDLKVADSEKAQYENDIQQALDHSDYSMEALRPVVHLIYSQTLHPSQAAFRLLAKIYSKANEPMRHIIRYAFLRLIRSDNPEQSQFAVEQVVALYPANDLERIVSYALEQKLLFTLDSTRSSWSNVNIHKVSLTIDFLKFLSNEEASSDQSSIILNNILGILYSWSKQFPQYYNSIRSALISSVVNLPAKSTIKPLILSAYDGIMRNFSISMDKVTTTDSNFYQEETFDWEDLLSYDKSVSKDHRKRILAAFRETTFFNESMYLFFEGKYLGKDDIPPQGIWITLLGAAHGKTVYRATIQGNERSYTFAINMNDELNNDQLRNELFWMMACSRDNQIDQLVETLGSYQAEYELWSEEFIPGLTARQYLKKSTWAGSSDEMPAPEYIWPHFVWTAVFTYTSFWKRTRFKKMIKVPSPGKIIIPTHDYYVGGRLVSISDIETVTDELAFLDNLEGAFVRDTETAFPEFDLKVNTHIIYHAIREALGQKHTPYFFNALLDSPRITKERKVDLDAFMTDVAENGFQCKSVYFASRRYHRWISLNDEATLNAKAHFLKDLFRDYNIQDSEAEYPDARVQLFSKTIFSDSDEKLGTYLSKLARNLRNHDLDATGLQSEISQYTNLHNSNEFEAFFLKRLAFPALPPSEDIELIATRSTTLDEIEIMISRHDNKGGMYRIRRAIHPKEIIQLQQLFLKANMDVGFTQEHRFLLALNEKERVIGGLFYLDQSDDLVYMDKVVVSDSQRGNGISKGLLDEFFNRMVNTHKKMITTGFLHPGYFYKFGFKIEKDQGGLVKYL